MYIFPSMTVDHVRVIILAGPPQSDKSKWKNTFTNDGQWRWISGADWRTEIQEALNDGADVVIDRENCTEDQRDRVYEEVQIYNTRNMEDTTAIEASTQVVTLVCHPSCGYGNKTWSELVGPTKALEIPPQRAYRVLDMDDGHTIHWNDTAMEAAARQQWDVVRTTADGVKHAKIQRDTITTKKTMGNISIMSYNILWQPETRSTWDKRLPTLLQEIQRQMPDILCMQEVSRMMYKDVQFKLQGYHSTFGIAAGSSFGCATFTKNNTIYVSHMSPLNVEDHNKQHKKSRFVAHITTMTHRSSQQKFGVCNVHLLYGFDDYMEAKRAECVQRIKNILKEDEYRMLPMLMCGDFNSKVGSASLREMAPELSDTYKTLATKDPEMTVEPYQHGEAIAVDYVFATDHFTPTSVLLMPKIKDMRRVQLPITGFEASDHLYHLITLRLNTTNVVSIKKSVRHR
jgi:endonuclease/exonuclease/phosphatase family metal-dependent hydrolase